MTRRSRRGGRSRQTERARGADRPDESGGSRRGPLWVLVVLLLIQVGLMAAAFLGMPHNGGDNAGYLGLASSILERGAYLDLYLPGEPIHTKYPPGFPLLLAGARLLGAETWIAFKAVAAGAASLSVLFTFLWVRERQGPVFAGLVAVLVAASSAVVYYSHWILSDVPFLALTFASLWCLERAEDRRWLVAGAALAVAAYFTRSAGLPLILALAVVLGLRRRWKALGAFSAAFSIPAFLWWLRNRGAPDTYLAEFWLVDPYQPDLGRVGAAGLVGRTFSNLWGYVSSHIPGGMTGGVGWAMVAIGLLLVGLAVFGWGYRLRKGVEAIGVVELFFPLYAGLILLWPEVWSADRFALPLFPVLLYFAWTALQVLVRRLHPRAHVPAVAVAVLLIGVPAAASWFEDARIAMSCRSGAVTQGIWACASPGTRNFIGVAAWSRLHLDESAVVLTRKPRIFYLMSGRKSASFPLSREAGAFLGEAERAGADFVLLDQIDGLASFYVGSAIQADPQAFCGVAEFGSPDQAMSQLLGVVYEGGEVRRGSVSSPSGGDGPADEPQGRVSLAPCETDLLGEEPGPIPDYSSSSIPLFRRSES